MRKGLTNYGKGQNIGISGERGIVPEGQGIPGTL